MSAREDIYLPDDGKDNYAAYDGLLQAERWRLKGVAMLYRVLHLSPDERNIVFLQGGQVKSS
jgi:hypothetical protein